MTDYEAVYGEYKSIICEWIDGDDETCCNDSVFGKSYCRYHSKMAYRVTSDDEFEKEVDAEIEASKHLTPEIINDR